MSALAKVICGNPVETLGAVAPYRSGPQLVDFFNEFGANHQYGGGFPSRWAYCEATIQQFNDQPTIVKIVTAALDPRDYLNTDFSPDKAANYLNDFLAYDGLVAVRARKHFELRRVGPDLVEVEVSLFVRGAPNRDFILEQLQKCSTKVRDGDYDGAITNARSLLEAILLQLEVLLSGAAQEYDGDLARLYKRVQKALNLEPSRTDIAESLTRILGGLASIVAGLGSLRNRMGDAHARSYKPSRHHAELLVNASRTLIGFLIDSFEYQQGRGTLSH